MTTKSYIVIKDKAQTLTNKTIDSDSNVIQNLEVGNLKNTAVSTAIPDTGAVNTKLTTEKAVFDGLDAKLDKQYTSAEDGYIAKVDPTDHVLKPMDFSQISDVQVVDTLPATGTENTLYVMETPVTILHKYVPVYTTWEAREDGIYQTAETPAIRIYTYAQVEQWFKDGVETESLTVDDVNGTVVRYSNGVTTACAYHLTPLHSGQYAQYVWKDSAYVAVSVSTNDFLRLTGGTMSGTINFTTDRSTPAIKGSPDGDTLITGGSSSHGVVIYGSDNFGSCGSLLLTGFDDAYNGRGIFKLYARSSAETNWLVGHAAGDLSWTGNQIAFNGPEAPIVGHLLDKRQVSYAGGSTTSKSASLTVMGKEHSTEPGWFRLKATDGTNTTELIGKPTGSLTWTGESVVFSGDKAYPIFGSASNDKTVSVSGGNGIDSAVLILYGKSNSSAPGRFYLRSTDGSQTAQLIGDPNGTLTWRGYNVLVGDSLSWTRATIGGTSSRGGLYVLSNKNQMIVHGSDFWYTSAAGTSITVDISSCIPSGKSIAWEVKTNFTGVTSESACGSVKLSTAGVLTFYTQTANPAYLNFELVVPLAGSI